MVHRGFFLSCVVLVAIAPACASSSKKGEPRLDLEGLDPTPLDEKGAMEQTPRKKPGAEQEEAKPVVARQKQQRPPPAQYAAALADDAECQQEIRRIADFEQDEETAWALMVACVRQGKFTNLEMLLDSPWRGRLDSVGEDQALEIVGHVIASRGATFEYDIPLVQKSHLQLFDLDAVLKEPDEHRNRLILMRGVVNAKKPDKRGQMIFEIDETARMTQAHEGLVQESSTYSTKRGPGGFGSGNTYTWSYSTWGTRSENATVRTGRILFGKVLRPEMKANLYEEYVFLARFDKIQKPKRDPEELDDSDEVRADIRLLRAFRPGAVIPQMSR